MRFHAIIVCLALVVSAVFLSKTASAAPLSDWVQGEVLYFGGPADGVDPNKPSGALVQGACGYGPFDLNSYPGYNVAVISPQNPLAANSTRHPRIGCGACLEITCIGATCPANGGEINPLIVMVADSCPSCTSNQLVIPYAIFQSTLSTSPSVGTATVKYRHVDCTPRGPIVIDVDTYRPTEGGYMRLSLESVAGSGALRSVELRGSSSSGSGSGSGGGAWLPMVNTYGAKWELSNLPNIPMDMRITSDNGTVLVQPEAINESRTGGFATFVQFTTTSTGITTPTPPSPSPSPVLPPAVVVVSPPPPTSSPPPPSSPPPSPPPSPVPSPAGIENPFLVTPTPLRSPSIATLATAVPPPAPSPPATPTPVSPPAPVAEENINVTASAPSPQTSGPLCINTVVTTVLGIPELSTTSQNIATAGLTSLLNNSSSVVTFFAPTNQAWAAVPSSVNLNDRATLQDIMLGLIVQGPVTLPSGASSASETSTLAAGGQLTVPVKTLNGAPLSAIASASGVVLRDENAASPDARITRAVRVCDSVVDVVDAVPLPF